MSWNSASGWNGLRITASIASMPEMPNSCENHGQAVFVAGGDGVLVAQGAAGLDDGSNAGAGGFIDIVAERKEGVRGQHAPLDPIAGLAHGQVDGIDAARLARADAGHHRLLRQPRRGA